MGEHLNIKNLGYDRKAYQSLAAEKGIPKRAAFGVSKRERKAPTAHMSPPFHLEDLDNPAFFTQSARQRHDIEKRVALLAGEKTVVDRLNSIARNADTDPVMAKQAALDSEILGRHISEK